MDPDVMLLIAVGACAVAAAVLAVAGAWLLRLDQRLRLSRRPDTTSISELVDALAAVRDDPDRLQRVATTMGEAVSTVVNAGLRLAREGAEPLAFGRELLASASPTRIAHPADRRMNKLIGLGILASALTVIAWALPLVLDTGGLARLAVGLGYVGVLALFAAVALARDSNTSARAQDALAQRLVIVAFLGLSVGESRDQIRARLLETVAPQLPGDLVRAA